MGPRLSLCADLGLRAVALDCGTHQVVQHADAERSFHVFYFFVAGLDGKVIES